VDGSVAGVGVGMVAGASGVVGGTGVGSGMVKRTCFGGFVAATSTLRSGRSVGGGVGVGVGVSITLRGCSMGGGVGTVVFGWVSVQMPVSKLVRFCNAVTWLSVRGASDAAGDGFWRAVVMSAKAAKMRSLEEARGMVTFVGNQETVSEIRSARVSSIQMV